MSPLKFFLFLSLWLQIRCPAPECTLDCSALQGSYLLKHEDWHVVSVEFIDTNIIGDWIGCKNDRCWVLAIDNTEVIPDPLGSSEQIAWNEANLKTYSNPFSMAAFMIPTTDTTGFASIQLSNPNLLGNVQCNTVGACLLSATNACTVSPSVCEIHIPFPECTADEDCLIDSYLCAASATCVEGQCQIVPKAVGTQCRAPIGLCDVEETCDGTSIECPKDVHYESGHECRAAADDCDVAETCNGVDPQCPDDAWKAANEVCRTAAGRCDVEEKCSGNSPLCPSDAARDKGYAYRCGTGDCYSCGVPNNDFSVNLGSIYGLGTCSVGKCNNVVQLPYPQCLSQCVNQICANGKNLLNVNVFSCQENVWECKTQLKGNDIKNGACPNWN